MQGFKIQPRNLFEQKSATAAEMRIFDMVLSSDYGDEAMALDRPPDIWTSPTEGIEIAVTNTGEESSLVTSVDLKSFSFTEGSGEKEYLDTKNLITGMKVGTDFYLQIYRLSKNLFFIKYYTGSWANMNYLTSAVSLRMLRVNTAGNITLGGAVAIGSASSASAYTHAHLLAAINEGKTPSDFMVLQTSTATATSITTYSVAAIYMNFSTLAIVSTGTSGAMAWSTIGNDGVYEFNIIPVYNSINEYLTANPDIKGDEKEYLHKWWYIVDPERYCAYITAKNLTNGAVNHRILHNRQIGMQSLNVSAESAKLTRYRILGLCSAGLLLINSREDYAIADTQWKIAHLDITTGELE